LKKFNKHLFRKLILAWVGAFFSPKNLASIESVPSTSVKKQMHINDSYLPPSKKHNLKGDDYQSKIDQLLSDDTVDVAGYHSPIAQMRLFLSLLDEYDLKFLKEETAETVVNNDGKKVIEKKTLSKKTSEVENENMEFDVTSRSSDSKKKLGTSEEYDPAWEYLRMLNQTDADPTQVPPQSLLPFVPIPPGILEGRTFSFDGSASGGGGKSVVGSDPSEGSVLKQRAMTGGTQGKRSILRRLCMERDNSENEVGNVLDESQMMARQRKWADQVYHRHHHSYFCFFVGNGKTEEGYEKIIVCELFACERQKKNGDEETA
jgi:hypothetical protein